MENLINKIKALETPQIIIYLLCAACFIFICYGIFSNGEDKGQQNKTANNLEFPEDGKKTVNFDSKLDAYGVKEDKENNIDLDFNTDFFTTDSTGPGAKENAERMENLKQQIEGIEGKKGTDNIYNEEDERMIRELQAEIENEKEYPKKTISPAPREKEASYTEKLALARQARIGDKEKNLTDTPEINKIEARAAIFRDQFKLPGDLVELVLTKGFTYKNKVFKKGTPIYAYINIDRTRVLFDIDNIALVPLKTEVRDIRDGRIGMYSTQAGELWDTYKSEAINEANEGLTDQISGGLGTRAVTESIKAISKFFQKKRLRNDEKILLLNDQELILTIIEQEP